MKPGRFDYVRYDEVALAATEVIKAKVMELEALIDAHIHLDRPHASAMQHLEECFMWVGKGLRDDQIRRNGRADLQDSRPSV